MIMVTLAHKVRGIVGYDPVERPDVLTIPGRKGPMMVPRLFLKKSKEECIENWHLSRRHKAMKRQRHARQNARRLKLRGKHRR